MKRLGNVLSFDRDWWKNERTPGEPPRLQQRRKLCDQYYSVKEAADRFSVSVDVIYDEIRSGALVADRIASTIRISGKALEDYLNRPQRRAR